VADLVRSQGLTGLLVSHHMNLVARFADRLVVLDRGRVVAAGTPREVLRRDVVEQVFAWPVAITEWDGVPQVVPLLGSPDASIRRSAGGGGDGAEGQRGEGG
jgi:iron complex transport system ATP-binding protein